MDKYYYIQLSEKCSYSGEQEVSVEEYRRVMLDLRVLSPDKWIRFTNTNDNNIMVRSKDIITLYDY